VRIQAVVEEKVDNQPFFALHEKCPLTSLESSIIPHGRAQPLIANAIKQLDNFANAAEEWTIPETDIAAWQRS
jgi:hypothetical protein